MDRNIITVQYFPAKVQIMNILKNIRGDRSGFSIIELVTIIAIIAVLAAIAIPSFSTMLPNYRLKSATQDLFSSFQVAKVNAVRNNTFCAVTFDIQIGGETYDYIVYLDDTNDRIYNGTDKILVQKKLSDYKDVFFDTAQGGGDGLTFIDNTNGQPTVTFRPNGLLNGAGGRAYLTNVKGREMEVVISLAGNIRVD